MKKIFVFLFICISCLICIKDVSAEEKPTLDYQTHVQNVGWQKIVKDNEISGTTGKSLRLEAIRINVVDLGELSGSIEYQTHVQSIGWQNWVTSTRISGTTGRSLRLEAIKIALKGEVAEYYDIYYQTHVQSVGWQNWVKNGEISGTTGRSLRIEGIRIKLVSKDTNLDLSYKSYVNEDGWQDYVKEGELSGTTGQGKDIQSINISLTNYTDLKGGVTYQTYITPNGWQDYVNNNSNSGVTGKSIEAIRIKLTDELAQNYDIYYRTHVSNKGWLDWTKNGEISGTIGYFKKVEGIEMKIKRKDDNSITTGKNAYLESINSISYSSHVQSVGWQNYVKDGELSGTSGKTLRLEAFKVKLDTKISGTIAYQAYVENKGWQSVIRNNEISGTTGEGKKIEAIRVNLEGEISNYYDVYYRVHASNIGWLGWTKNSSKAGSVGFGTQIEAMEIKIVKKGLEGPDTSKSAYVTGTWKTENGNKYYYTYKGQMLTGFQFIDGIKYYFNPEGVLIGTKVKKVVDVSSWQKTIDWNTIKKDGDVDEVILRVGWGTSVSDECGVDSTFDTNIKAVQKLGIPYSIYIYAYAKQTSAAIKEADFVINMMKKYNIPSSTFVWYDAELDYSKDVYENSITTFVNHMKSKGYNNVGVYSSVTRFVSTNGNLNSDKIKQYPLWIAQYYKKLQYSGTYKGWQYTSSGTINGISGNVDVNMFY